MTPLLSFLLSRLICEASTGANNTKLSLDWLGLKYFTMEPCGTAWIDQFQKRVLTLVLRQDQAWFHKAEHSAVRLVQAMVKDADDMWSLVAVILGQCTVVA